jgi:branched-chain amino acid transport system ATP-binding protein
MTDIRTGAPSAGTATLDGAAGGSPRIEARNISMRFGGIVALDSVSIDVPPGQIRGLIGPNGAGKTTLFDIISGLRPPTEGEVFMDGIDITSTSPMSRARAGMRRTFQRQQVFSWLSVEDNILAAMEWRGGGGGLLGDTVGWIGGRKLEKERRKKVEELLHQCDLYEIRGHPVGNLPIAKVRLVEIARAIADEPVVLLLDEPTSGLHVTECEQVANVVRRHREETGASFIIVEHDIEFVLGLCDQITVLELGAIIFNGDPDSARKDPGVRRAYLG